MIETLIIVQGNQINAVYWDFLVHFWCQNKGLLATEEKCHFNKLSMAIKWQIRKYAYKLHGIWGRAVGIAA
jgi:hypothetical protein